MRTNLLLKLIINNKQGYSYKSLRMPDLSPNINFKFKNRVKFSFSNINQNKNNHFKVIYYLFLFNGREN